MRKIDSKPVSEPKEVLKNSFRDGQIHCSCGHVFDYCVGLIGDIDSENVGEWFGLMVPICPECETIPSPDSRRMDN